MRALLALTALLLVHLPLPAQACAVCLGGAESNVRGALNGAIFVMLGCIGAMLALIGAVGVSIVRRARAQAQVSASSPGQ